MKNNTKIYNRFKGFTLEDCDCRYCLYYGGRRKGKVNCLADLQKRINIGLKKVLGFWVERPPKRKNDIRCLCGKCLNDYKSNSAYIIRSVSIRT